MIRRVLFVISFSICTLGFAQTTNERAVDKTFSSTSSTSISVFPNPTTHYFQVSHNDEIAELVITDLLGKKVKLFRYAPDAQYDVQDLRKGMYLVQILSEDQKVLKIQRLIKDLP